jgi:hypothetical protein
MNVHEEGSCYDSSGRGDIIDISIHSIGLSLSHRCNPARHTKNLTIKEDGSHFSLSN